jgi:hypothetical protein
MERYLRDGRSTPGLQKKLGSRLDIMIQPHLRVRHGVISRKMAQMTIHRTHRSPTDSGMEHCARRHFILKPKFPQIRYLQLQTHGKPES